MPVRRATKDRKTKKPPRASVRPSAAKSAVRSARKFSVLNPSALVPPDVDNINLEIEGKEVKLTNLRKVFWPNEGYTKGDLLRYYAAVAHVLLPHIRDRAMVMKRYPNGINADYFFMKRAPDHRPDWLPTCSIAHTSAGVVDFPVINDLASLMWVINLGCIDLNQWYARCDDVDRPDYMHFDLDPVKPATKADKDVPFKRVLETALVVREALKSLKIECYAKTSGSRGIHVYVPIKRGPTQKDVWTLAKGISQTLARAHRGLITAEYKVSKRPAGHVLVDYNQNAWGRTLASVYSIRPRARATVSAPVNWKEVERGFEIDDFRIDNMPARVRKLGDLFAPVLHDSPSGGGKNRLDVAALL